MAWYKCCTTVYLELLYHSHYTTEFILHFTSYHVFYAVLVAVVAAGSASKTKNKAAATANAADKEELKFSLFIKPPQMNIWAQDTDINHRRTLNVNLEWI